MDLGHRSLTRVALCALALASCKGGDDHDSGPVVPVVRFVLGQDPMTSVDRVANGLLEIAGVSGDLSSVDVPLEKLPKDLHGLAVSIDFPTPCGVKKVAVALPPNDDAEGSDQYKPKLVHDAKVGYEYVARLAFNQDYPHPTRVYVDPDTSGPLTIGSITGTVTKGVPDDKLSSQKVAASSGFLVQELDCGAHVTIAGHSADIPYGHGALFVTADASACFYDEEVGYGDTGSHGTSRSGSNVYRLAASSYDFYFVKADQRAAAAVTASRTTRSRIDHCAE